MINKALSHSHLIIHGPSARAHHHTALQGLGGAQGVCRASGLLEGTGFYGAAILLSVPISHARNGQALSPAGGRTQRRRVAKASNSQLRMASTSV